MKRIGKGWFLAAAVVWWVPFLNPVAIVRADPRPVPHLHVKGQVKTPGGQPAAGATIYQGPGWEQQLRSSLTGVPPNCIERLNISVKADGTYEFIYLFENTAACVTAMNNATVDKSKVLWTVPSPPLTGQARYGWDYKVGKKM